VLAIVYVVGSVSLVAFFPRQASQPPDTAAGLVAPPTEVIAEDQLAEFDKWIEAQPRVQLPVSADGARVVVVKFNDYQCPSCRQTYVEYKAILDKLKTDGRVKFVTMDFPLDSECNTAGIHGSACEAAAAVRMARARNKGEAMEEYLFSNQERFTPDFVKNAAKEVAQVTDFDAEYPKMLEAIRADAALGRQLGVQATPTFFINGIKISGGLRPAYFEAVIEHELKKAGATS
jgi:protein-disulfide isomerase